MGEQAKDMAVEQAKDMSGVKEYVLVDGGQLGSSHSLSMQGVREMLTALNLSQYSDAFEEQGYDDIGSMRAMTSDQLVGVMNRVKMIKPGHQERLIKWHEAGATDETAGADVSNMWQQSLAYSWGGFFGWSPESQGFDWGAAASGDGQWQLPGDDGWATQREEGHPWRDPWTPLHVGNLLKKLASFKMVDESRSGKLGQKNLGVWDLLHRVSHDGSEDLEAQELDMFTSFVGADVPYKTRKLVDWGNTVGKHELVQKLLAMGSASQKMQLAIKFDGQVKYLINNRFGSLVLQQLLREASKMVESLDSVTLGDTIISQCIHRGILEPPDRDMTDMLGAVVTAMKSDLCEPQAIEDSSLCPHGNHVMRKWVQLLQSLPGEQDCLRQITQTVGENAVVIGTTQTGCRVIQQLLDTPDRYPINFLLFQDVTFAKLVTSEFGNFVMVHILDSKYERHIDDKLVVLQKVVDNFVQQSLGNFDNLRMPQRPQHECFYLTHQFARHVVKKCLVAPVNMCRGWSELRNQVVRLVLDNHGSLKYQFHCLDGCDSHMVEMLHAIKFGHLPRSRASSGRSGRRSVGTGHR